jgi:hypothetical protein
MNQIQINKVECSMKEWKDLNIPPTVICNIFLQVFGNGLKWSQKEDGIIMIAFVENQSDDDVVYEDEVVDKENKKRASSTNSSSDSEDEINKSDAHKNAKKGGDSGEASSRKPYLDKDSFDSDSERNDTENHRTSSPTIVMSKKTGGGDDSEREASNEDEEETVALSEAQPRKSHSFPPVETGKRTRDHPEETDGPNSTSDSDDEEAPESCSSSLIHSLEETSPGLEEESAGLEFCRQFLRKYFDQGGEEMPQDREDWWRMISLIAKLSWCPPKTIETEDEPGVMKWLASFVDLLNEHSIATSILRWKSECLLYLIVLIVAEESQRQKEEEKKNKKQKISWREGLRKNLKVGKTRLKQIFTAGNLFLEYGVLLYPVKDRFPSHKDLDKFAKKHLEYQRELEKEFDWFRPAPKTPRDLLNALGCESLQQDLFRTLSKRPRTEEEEEVQPSKRSNRTVIRSCPTTKGNSRAPKINKHINSITVISSRAASTFRLSIP